MNTVGLTLCRSYRDNDKEGDWPSHTRNQENAQKYTHMHASMSVYAHVCTHTHTHFFTYTQTCVWWYKMQTDTFVTW